MIQLMMLMSSSSAVVDNREKKVDVFCHGQSAVVINRYRKDALKTQACIHSHFVPAYPERTTDNPHSLLDEDTHHPLPAIPKTQPA